MHCLSSVLSLLCQDIESYFPLQIGAFHVLRSMDSPVDTHNRAEICPLLVRDTFEFSASSTLCAFLQIEFDDIAMNAYLGTTLCASPNAFSGDVVLPKSTLEVKLPPQYKTWVVFDNTLTTWIAALFHPDYGMSPSTLLSGERAASMNSSIRYYIVMLWCPFCTGDAPDII